MRKKRAHYLSFMNPLHLSENLKSEKLLDYECYIAHTETFPQKIDLQKPIYCHSQNLHPAQNISYNVSTVKYPIYVTLMR